MTVSEVIYLLYVVDVTVGISQALSDSTQVELSPDQARIRRKEEPEKWIISGAQIPDSFHSDLSYDSPEFIPGQPYPFNQRDTGKGQGLTDVVFRC